MARKEERDGIEIDFGAGKISFGGVFKGLGSLIDLASRLNEEGVKGRGEIGGRQVRGVYGFSVRTLGGKPVIESFGNVRETARGPVVEEVREPMVDVFDEEKRVLVIAELPGVSEDRIEVEVSGDILSLSASDGDRRYAREILLPARVKAGSMRRVYKNGILEITLEKEK